MGRTTLTVVVAVAALSSALTAGALEATRPEAATADANSGTLRSIDRHLAAIQKSTGAVETNLGSSRFSHLGVYGQLTRLIDDQAKACRAIAERSFDCPIASR